MHATQLTLLHFMWSFLYLQMSELAQLLTLLQVVRRVSGTDMSSSNEACGRYFLQHRHRDIQ